MKQKNETNYATILDDFRQSNTLRDVTLNAHHWRYYTVGDAQNEPLLLLHGGGADAEAMFRYIEGFAEHYYVIAPNIPSRITKIADAVVGLRALLAYESIAQAHLIGISFGAMLAQCYIRSFEDTVRNLLITHTVIPSEHLVAPVKMQRNLIMIYPEPFLLWLSKRSYHNAISKSLSSGSLSQKQFWQAYFDEAYSGRIGKQHLFARTSISMDYHQNYRFQSDDLKHWQGKLLIIESDEDEVISEGNRGSLLGMYSRAYVQTLYGYDHLAPFLAAEQMLSSMQNFLLEAKRER